jgi:hypothetical protein
MCRRTTVLYERELDVRRFGRGWRKFLGFEPPLEVLWLPSCAETSAYRKSVLLEFEASVRCVGRRPRTTSAYSYDFAN